MSYIDVEGKTREEAIEKALAQLGMEAEDVSIEVLALPKSGFLGIGGTPARVRVSYGPEEVVEAKEEQPRVSKKEVKAPKEEKKLPKEEKKETPKKEQPKVVQEENLPLCTDENAKAIQEFLMGLLERLDCVATCNVYETEKLHYKVILVGEKLGQLIGRRGETLDAIQQLANYSLNKDKEKRIRVQIDAENYRAKREQSLESLAKKVAGKVIKYRRSVTLEPMNAYERHVIHSTLQDEPNVSTYSVGVEPNRRVVVAYGKDK